MGPRRVIRLQGALQMFRRSLVLVVAALFVAALAMVPELANPASGSPALTRSGQVFPTSMNAGGTTRFCGAGFAAGAAVEVLVGGQSAQSTRALDNGTFCVGLRASDSAQGPTQLLAVGRNDEGNVLQVAGGVAVAQSVAALRPAALPSVGPLSSSDSPLVLGLWAAIAVVGAGTGLVLIAAQRRRVVVPHTRTDRAE